jgi:hypothetical protein
MGMQCAFCFEEMNPGATVCKVCSRQQPLSAEAKSARLFKIFAVAIVALVVCGAGYFALDAAQHSADVEKIVECARLHGDKTLTADFANAQIVDGMKQTGKGWRAGEEYAALEFTTWGQASTGACFISKETLFSN